MKYLFYCSASRDGWMNLATDEYFLDHLKKDEFLLYFYINKNAVIIGRNQNAWKECHIDSIDKDNVQLVRRVSGGGAVYHDEGNLNFSFIANDVDYNLEKQLSVILQAVKKMGIEAQFTGRNDLTVKEKKFSGNAFVSRGGRKMHHGTLLINANLSKLANYLNVSPQKICSKGIESVRSRVCNLTDYVPQLTTELVLAAVKQAYEECYGMCEAYSLDEQAQSAIEELYRKHSSWEWRLGETFPFDYETETRFVWGGIQLCLKVKEGIIEDVTVYTDALDTNLSDKIREALSKSRFHTGEMAERIKRQGGAQMDELSDYILTLGL